MPPSSRPFMGATPYPGGVTFRVWAPFASRVAAAGTFNGMAADAHPLSSQGAGYWSTDVFGAKVGQQYKFVITNRDTGAVLWKNDPYARELTHSAGDSVIAAGDFTWSSEGYATPSWNELVVY